MENRELLVTFLVPWLIYVVSIHGYAWGGRLAQASVALSHATPSLVVISMTYIFPINHGATVRQLVSGSERGMNLWSAWVDLWPLLLLATSGSALAQGGWFLVACTKREWRRWTPVALLGAIMSAFAFVTVMVNFPDA